MADEIEAGSVQHEQVLKSFPNATSYGPDHNVVEPAPPEGSTTKTEAHEHDLSKPVAKPADTKPTEPTTKGKS
jgi:hypothetical protein